MMFSPVRKTSTLILVLGRNVFFLNLALLGMVIALAMFSIIQINRVTTKGYYMRDLETEIAHVMRENQAFEIEATEARSLATVSQKVQMLGLVKSNAPVYVSGTGAVTFER
jgi:hypothetical protein